MSRRESGKSQDYGSYRKSGKNYEPESSSFELRVRSRQRSSSRETRSGQVGLSRSRSRSPGRTDSRSRSRSPGRTDSRSGSRSRSQSADKKGCLRCGSGLHDGKFCTVFAFCETKCKICNLYHRTQQCNKNSKFRIQSIGCQAT